METFEEIFEEKWYINAIFCATLLSLSPTDAKIIFSTRAR